MRFCLFRGLELSKELHGLLLYLETGMCELGCCIDQLLLKSLCAVTVNNTFLTNRNLCLHRLCHQVSLLRINPCDVDFIFEDFDDECFLLAECELVHFCLIVRNNMNKCCFLIDSLDSLCLFTCIICLLLERSECLLSILTLPSFVEVSLDKVL